MPKICTIETCSVALLCKIKDCLSPIPHDEIIFRSPYHQHTNDYTVGVCLYDIGDNSPSQTAGSVYRQIDNGSVLRTPPPKLVELRYMLYVNESAKFGERQIETEHKIFSKLIDAVYVAPYLGERELPIFFSFLSLEEKFSLWQGFSQPMQTALYLNAGPLPIDASRSEIIPIVDSLGVNAERKKECLE
ncbi:MAG: DUF4255 domain-containing protein [Eubacterium sp.]|jgi:hypothetical protein|nr:DUF4255 domain-containing protein [Eubacterium sp.]